MRGLATVLAIAGLMAFAATATADDKKPDDKKPADKGDKDGKDGAPKLEGGYTIVSGERDGKAIPEAEIKGATVRFTKDEILGTDKDKKDLFTAKYTLDASAKPWKITMKTDKPKEVETVGLIKKEGDTITIVYALPGGKEPTEFKTSEKQNLFVLKNLNKGDKDKAGDKPEK